MALRAPRKRRPPARRARRTSRTPPRWRRRWTATTSSSTWPRIPTSRARRPSRPSTSGRAPRSPSSVRRGDADDQREAHPLRVGQRRLRRSRHARGRRGPRPAGAGLDLRRQQARGRGADRQLRAHVRPLRLRLPLRQRGRPAPDARRRLRLRARAAARGSGGRAADLAAHPRRRHQCKSYIHVDDVVARGVDRARRRRTRRSHVYNVATGDYITVREIAELAVECVGLAPDSVRFAYTGGDRGWKGDVPSCGSTPRRIRALGWRCERLLARGAARSRCWR